VVVTRTTAAAVVSVDANTVARPRCRGICSIPSGTSFEKRKGSVATTKANLPLLPTLPLLVIIVRLLSKSAIRTEKRGISD
jgi:hypothetical protein